jgi:DNA/RNA non-specific endonuclease
MDVRGQYVCETFTRNGKLYKRAYGWLGMPGQVATHRSNSAQRAVAGGTGDDAGHLIGNRFGAPGGEENLSPQNWKANRFGTYKDLENRWAALRLAGADVYVQVTDISRPGQGRPFMRNVQWIERQFGRQRTNEVIFANAHTPESRMAQAVASTSVGEDGGEVIHVDFKLRQRIP